MPEWLYILLGLVVNVIVSMLLQRRAYNRGYDAGIDDSLTICREVDDILRDPPRSGSR